MDAANHFETRTTFRLIRLEYLVGLGAAVYFLVTHLGEINWWVFAALFLYIDLIGYIPGTIAFHRSGTKRISKVYYVLYNTMHSLATQTLVALSIIMVDGPQWALLALPVHLFGDRALFGNFLKPFGLSFEPVAHQGFTELQRNIEGAAPATPVPGNQAVLS